MSMIADWVKVISSLPPWLLPVLAGVLGAALGSFANVCIVRIPRGQSIVWPPSYCPECGHRLSWWENIPLVSYLLLRGRCHVCRRPIAPQYPIVELLCVVLSIAVWEHFEEPLRYFVFFGLFVLPLVIASFIDLAHMIIPDSITLPGILVGAVAHRFLSGAEVQEGALFDSIAGVLVGGGVLYVIAVAYEKLRGREGLGGGDVKLMAMLGAFFGWRAAMVILLLSSVLGSAVGIFLVAFFRRSARHAIPFGPFLSASGIIVFFLGPYPLERLRSLVASIV